MNQSPSPLPARKPLPGHGTLSRAKYHRCKCLTCADAARDYNRTARRRTAYGTWQGLSDPAPVRAHVRALREAGLGVRQIALLSGVSVVAVQRLLSSDPNRMQRGVQAKTVRALMAVKAEDANLADGALIDATGTRRRIEALAVMGFTNRAMAAHIGTNPLYVGDLRVATTITVRNAAAVAAAYDRLWDQNPAAYGVTAQSINRARNLAARNGWVSPLAWDDETIDDPAAEPNFDGAADIEGAAEPRPPRAQLMAEAKLLYARGMPNSSVAERLGVAERTVIRWKSAGWGEAA